MGHPPAKPYISYADYFEAEETADERHEWIDGVVYAMSRGTPEHGRLVLYVQGANVSTYADVTVVCAPVLKVFRRPADDRGAWACEEGRDGETVLVHGTPMSVDAVYA
jgi:hypothetical protein